MHYSSLTLKDKQLKNKYCLALISFVFCVLLIPMEGQAQNYSAGIFTFTGSHNPLGFPIFREWLPGEGLRAGPVQVHPFLGIAESFTDNVFRTDKRRRSDFLTTIAPGIQAYMPFGGKHSILLDYRAGQFLFKKFNENNVLAQNGSGHVKFSFPGGLKIDLQGEHTEGFDPRGSALDSRDDDITKWRATSFLGETRWDERKWGILLRTRFTRWHYKNNGQAPIRDRKNARASLTGSLKATPTVSALFGANIGNNTYDDNKQLDSFSYGVFTGLALAPSRLLSGNVTIGYTVLNFDKAPKAPVQDNPLTPEIEVDPLLSKGLSLGGEQQQSLTFQGNLNWRPTSRSSLNIQPYRFIRQSGTSGTSTFIQTGVSIFGRHQLTPRVALNGTIYYTNNDFEDSRRDNEIRPRIGLEYRTVKWLGFRLDYRFAKRFSNESGRDFYSNSIMVSVQGLL